MSETRMMPSNTSPAVRAAVVQMDIALGENAENLRRILQRVEEASEQGADLIVFPECALSGYCFGSLQEAKPFSEVPGLSENLKTFADACVTRKMTGVLGFLEYDPHDDVCHNSALCVSPATETGIIGDIYRKTHLPTLGVDRYVTPGRRFIQHLSPYGVLAPLICYDLRFPEAARAVALQGAEALVLPTNWPEGAESSPDFLTRARAWENRYYVLASNRVGVERGRRFIGRSQIVAPTGEILAEAGSDEETILYADLDMRLSRSKRIINEPGEWELDVLGDRNPAIYSALTDQNLQKRWTPAPPNRSLP
jgi:predicted amidohydrolase